jgi:hypothetical protein
MPNVRLIYGYFFPKGGEKQVGGEQVGEQNKKTVIYHERWNRGFEYFCKI